MALSIERLYCIVATTQILYSYLPISCHHYTAYVQTDACLQSVMHNVYSMHIMYIIHVMHVELSTFCIHDCCHVYFGLLLADVATDCKSNALCSSCQRIDRCIGEHAVTRELTAQGCIKRQ